MVPTDKSLDYRQVCAASHPILCTAFCRRSDAKTPTLSAAPSARVSAGGGGGLSVPTPPLHLSRTEIVNEQLALLTNCKLVSVPALQRRETNDHKKFHFSVPA